MENMKVAEYDPEFLYKELEKESINAEHWHQKYKKLERELILIQQILSGVITEFKE